MSTFSAQIPDPTGNPFIKLTSLPEGTLFIAVGSILLGFIVLVLAWRAYTVYMSWSIAASAEARFTALEPNYGGPFVDPVEQQDAEPETHPTGVPLKFRRGKLNGKPQTKSLADKSRDAHLQGKFFSPTTEVLLHGSNAPKQPSPPVIPQGFYEQQPGERKKIRPPSAYLDDLINK